MTATTTDGSSLRKGLHEDGFVVIRQMLTPAQLEILRAAARSTTELARSGGWPHIRTVGKQFPPWPATPGPEGIWGVQGLLNPALPEHAAFTESYFGRGGPLEVAKELMGAGAGCGDDDLVLELYNMLVRPERDFALRWHRDDIGPEATDEEELERLRQPEWHTQWNLALYADDSLVVVPGSHARARTAAERAADPFAPELPGQLVVHLNPGDVVFYNNNILHRGVYDSSRERMSLHGSVGHVAGGRLRARNVLQHGIGAWVDRCDFSTLAREEDRARAEGMRARVVKLGQESGDVGYSLAG
ncbi:phytanoyl-CoA dioxygenase family protein [Xylariales sp. PMI_506]|nr:phytanoyl-CoA dioxygenase family protein [Xylariales sp. PMI_506]